MAGEALAGRAEGLKPMIASHGFARALPVALYTTDAEGHITFYNQAAADLWGHRTSA